MDPPLIPSEKTVKKTSLILNLIESVSEGFPTYSWSASKLVRFACDMVSLVNFWSGVKSRGIHLAETFDTQIHYAKCSLLAHERCQRYWLSDSQLNVCHPSRVCAHEQCFPSCCYLWVDTPVIIFEALLAHLKMRYPPLTVAYERAIFPNIVTILA